MKGGPLRDDDAQRIGQRIEHLMSANGRSVTPMDLVEDARPKNSSLHEYFEWNDTKAAEQFRMKQAGYLLGHIIVHVEYEGQKHQSRAFVNVRDVDSEARKPTRVYVEVERALGREEMRDQLIADALREASYWRRKYAMLKELDNIFKEIDKAEERYAKKKK